MVHSREKNILAFGATLGAQQAVSESVSGKGAQQGNTQNFQEASCYDTNGRQRVPQSQTTLH